MKCVSCSSLMETDSLDPSCERCGAAVLLVSPAPRRLQRSRLDSLPPGVWRYGDFLPRVRETVTLGEGGTPLLRAARLADEVGLKGLLVKDESRNPTGSFMDRGATLLLSLAKSRYVKECACETTGNLGASLAAYCAKAGVVSRMTVHPGTDAGKLYQMLAYGAEVEPSGSRRPPRRPGSLNVTAGNPYLVEGEKTTGFEIVQELGWSAPDVIVVPVGTGGHLSSIWRSLTTLRDSGLAGIGGCRLLGAQVKGGEKGAGRSQGQRPILAELEESVPFFSGEADRAMEESGGRRLNVTPSQTIESTRLLARSEGIFAEPSSASVVAALSDAVRQGLVGRSETVVCVITGAGLKDTKSVTRLAREARRAASGDPYAFPSRKLGETKLSLMKALRRKPTYGYQLWLELGERRRISTASVYQHLSELEGFSLIRKKGPVVSKGRERVLYELTRRGADFLGMSERLEPRG